MNKSKKIAIWLIWLLFWPSGLYALFVTLNPPLTGQGVDIFAFMVLASIVAFFPLKVGEHPVFFTHGIAFAVFLYYGLFIEVLVSQTALIFLMITLRVNRANLHRVPLNFMMFLVISVSSALVYYALGGEHGEGEVISAGNVLPLVAYAFSQIIFNQFAIKMIARFIYNTKVKWIDKGLIWDILTAALVLPVGFLLYMVYAEIGLSAIFLVGIPFIFISGMLMLYHNSREINEYLKRTSKIGHELTGNLGVKDVLDLFVERISHLLPLDYIYIFDVHTEKNMKLIRFFDRSGETDFPELQLDKGESVSGYTWKKGTSYNYRKKKEWEHLMNEFTPDQAESCLSIPVERNGEIVGVITIYSRQKRAFMQFQFMILNILGSYLAVAIENARHYEKTKEESVRCPLTGLYNFRYLEDKLHELFVSSPKEQPISLILLDLDRFKRVNDTYGHESGNEILCLLADLLCTVVEDDGIVARYGGEEFVIVLPDFGSEQAFYLAEQIRVEIMKRPFRSYQHMTDEEGYMEVEVTASIGVATYPDDCEEPLELIRHADRAMYVGAKQKGRNRVASYERLKKAVE
ncbi:diguanylate cyclase [Halobacillus fulvus]|nr:diguanylate cyclase [Halobacillus fulvus]